MRPGLAFLPFAGPVAKLSQPHRTTAPPVHRSTAPPTHTPTVPHHTNSPLLGKERRLAGGTRPAHDTGRRRAGVHASENPTSRASLPDADKVNFHPPVPVPRILASLALGQSGSKPQALAALPNTAATRHPGFFSASPLSACGNPQLKALHHLKIRNYRYSFLAS